MFSPKEADHREPNQTLKYLRFVCSLLKRVYLSFTTVLWNSLPGVPPYPLGMTTCITQNL
jgi:hypothetical protein